MASRPVTFVAGVLAGAALTSLLTPVRHEVLAPCTCTPVDHYMSVCTACALHAMHCSCTACALHVHCQATVEHVASSAAEATGHAMLPDGFTGTSSAAATSSGSGHSPGSEVRLVDEGKAAANEGGARSVPPRRPCSVGWRGATVRCTSEP